MKTKQITIRMNPYGINQANTTTCYNGDKIVKTFSYVISVKVDKKYKYFIITQKIYRYEIISIMRFNECNQILYVNEEGKRKEITQNG